MNLSVVFSSLLTNESNEVNGLSDMRCLVIQQHEETSLVRADLHARVPVDLGTT